MAEQKPDYRENTVTWFAELELARRRGDYERAAKAQQQLRRLGVKVQYEPAGVRL